MHAGALLALEGIVGFLYVLRLVRRTRLQTAYEPDAEDWVWYALLPLIVYFSLIVWGALLESFPEQTLFGVAATDVALIFMGIHNAWDVVTYLALEQLESKDDQK